MRPYHDQINQYSDFHVESQYQKKDQAPGSMTPFYLTLKSSVQESQRELYRACLVVLGDELHH